MLKKTLSPLILISLFFFNCDLISVINNIFFPDTNNIHNHNKGEGLCIYPTEVELTDNYLHQNYNIDSARIINYRHRNFNIDSAYIINNPIITYNEIISYDTTLHILEMTISRESLKSRCEYTKPFLITLDLEKMYGGWFWSPFSLISCNWEEGGHPGCRITKTS